jgi:hypothetical protein
MQSAPPEKSGEDDVAVAITLKRMDLIVRYAGSSEPRVKWELGRFACAL